MGFELAATEHERATDEVVRVGARGATREEHHRDQRSHGATVALLGLLLLAACSPALDEMNGIFYDGDDRRVHCGANLDEKAKLSTADILAAIDRAADRGEVIELYAHAPGRTVSFERLETVLARARDRGLAFLTYAELAARATGPGIALSFDDHSTMEWTSLRPTLMTFGARVTFFVSGYGYLDEAGRAQLRQLAADGHEIAAHTVNHLRAPPYVEENGLGPYLETEVVPSIEILRDDGYEIRSFAYPFGARTSEIDDAILEHVAIVRSIEFPYTASIQSTCPN